MSLEVGSVYADPPGNAVPASTALFLKLASAHKAIGAVTKDGYNAAQHYKYAQAADVFSEVRDQLAEHGVLLFASLTDVQTLPTEKVDRDTGEVKPGMPLTRATLSMRFIDADSGETFEQSWMGEGSDFGDKALNKAYTAALKTFLIAQFQIPTVGDDTEADADTDRHAHGQRPRGNGQPPQRAPGSKITPNQLEKFVMRRATQLGKSRDDVEQIAKARFGVERVEDLPRMHVDGLVAALGEPVPVGGSDVPADPVQTGDPEGDPTDLPW